MLKRPIYLDYAATTPVAPSVAAAMSDCLTMDGIFGNAASRSHLYGWQAEEKIEDARLNVAQLIGADTREIVWTSGATESNNLALKGVAQGCVGQRHIITSKIEHKSVLDTCQFLEDSGCEVTYLEPQEDGIIRPNQVEAALRPDTVLVSLMHVNNEIGVINPIESIGKLCREKGVLLHVDAAQSAGKVEINVVNQYVDLLSISAHKMYGPKGVGALYVRRTPPINLAIQMHGGGHERGMRSGTLATHQIVGLGSAAALCSQDMAQENKRVMALRELFLSRLNTLNGFHINGSMAHRVAGNLNLSFDDVDGETLLISLRSLAVSSGSACVSTSVEPSYVLSALGVPRNLAHASVRFSFGRYTTEKDVIDAATTVEQAVNQLRQS